MRKYAKEWSKFRRELRDIFAAKVRLAEMLQRLQRLQGDVKSLRQELRVREDAAVLEFKCQCRAKYGEPSYPLNDIRHIQKTLKIRVPEERCMRRAVTELSEELSAAEVAAIAEFEAVVRTQSTSVPGHPSSVWYLNNGEVYDLNEIH